MKKEIKFMSADGKAVRLTIETGTKAKTARDWDTLEEVVNPKVLSMCGDCCNGYGQVADSFVPTQAQKLLVDFWHEYHLNDFSAGTRKQEECLAEAGVSGGEYNYDKAVSVLKKAGLLYDRGYIYGHGWLYRPFDEDELNRIVEAVEREESDRLAAKSAPYDGIDIWDDGPEAVSAMRGIVEKTLPEAGDPTAVIALMRHTGTPMADIDTIECHDDCCYSVGGKLYYCGLRFQLEDVAESLLTRDEWAAAVAGGCTDQSFYDWKAEAIDSELGNILNSYDGTLSEYSVDGYDYLVCEQ